jgi:hypothetical protein
VQTPINDKGIVTKGIKPARKLARNKKMMANTNKHASKIVCLTSCKDAAINFDEFHTK